MSINEPDISEILVTVSTDIGRFSSNFADYIDTHLEQASRSLRESVKASPWLPESFRPKSNPFSRKPVIPVAPPSVRQRILGWFLNHKLLTGVVLVTISGITYQILKRKFNPKKRKAKRAKDGSRLEVVVIAGQAGEPFTRSISLDLERRGYIVFIVCSTTEEERVVQNEARPDIKALALDIRNPSNAKASIERFSAYLHSPHAAFPGAKSQYYIMRSLIVIPASKFPTIPIASLSQSTLSDLLNTCLLQPIIMIQYFLPLLQNLSLKHTNTCSGTPLEPKPSILMLTPTIIPSINPAFHFPEASITSAISSFTSVLEQEVAPLSVSVTHLQLGNFDISPFCPHHRLNTLQSQRAETLGWDEITRNNYGHNYAVSTTAKWKNESNLRVLNRAILDAMYNRHGGTIRVGSGSSVYGFVGKWVPRGVVGWMMGLRKVNNDFVDVDARVGTGGNQSDATDTAKVVEGKFPYGQKEEEEFGDSGVWSLGFESKIGADEFHS